MEILKNLSNGRYGRFLGDRIVKKEEGFYFFGYTNAQNGSYCSEEVFLSSDFATGYYYLFQRGRGGEQGKKRGEIKSLKLIQEKIIMELEKIIMEVERWKGLTK